MKKKLLIIDDEQAICSSLSFALDDKYQIWTATDERSSLEILTQTAIDLVLLDLNLGRTSGLDLLPQIIERRPEAAVIMMTAYGTIESSVQAMKAGAYHYITKPLNLEEVRLLLHKAAEYRQLHRQAQLFGDAARQQHAYAGLIGKSQPMQRLIQFIERLKQINSNILITGESGTGKELVARAIHFQGERQARPFSVINCAAIPENLLESELFGYEKGAFSGAYKRKEGLVESTDGGTLFLDEIGEMPLALQAKILRVIEDRQVTPLGSLQPKEVDIRFIAATNRNLLEEVRKGTFREDLFYRLNVIPLHLPPLRERREDIPLLIEHFLALFAINLNKQRKTINNEVKKRLYAYNYPGNVRELANIVEYAVALAPSEVITIEDLPPTLSTRLAEPLQAAAQQEGLFLPADLPLHEVERRYTLYTLERSGFHRKKTAEVLQVSERSLRQKVKHYMDPQQPTGNR
ncbi:sigma-54 dependent transcriptional regulator [Brevibacillus humidisoli]|uniref:sigma-54-dependent transcriptional regulator n=1 Tax=Brevibacillus humidisoli TaxID=2895522 RepID=UPI001E292482|nr:sigma-54 dependent transcriptional regulator [Brevibacillus humidisoli]UFJ39980.1 sigma-54 dependent transcriptional regulator [Brevibacillus humidisoli]